MLIIHGMDDPIIISQVLRVAQSRDIDTGFTLMIDLFTSRIRGDYPPNVKRVVLVCPNGELAPEQPRFTLADDDVVILPHQTEFGIIMALMRASLGRPSIRWFSYDSKSHLLIEGPFMA